MTLALTRLERERVTMAAMMAIFCQGHHGKDRALCPECQALLDYAAQRLSRCVFQENKPTCVRCPVHCYRPTQRDQVKVVMRYGGPRMVWRHPILALRHWLDGRARWVQATPPST